jgi:cellulose 1,4-beta-cellobiosidase
MAHKGDSSVATNTVVTQEDGTPFPLTVSPASQLTVRNGASGGLAVSLPVKPSQNVTVKTTVVDGSAQMTVTGGATLTFTSGNFATPQGVTLQSVAGQAGWQRVQVAPSGVDTPGYAAVCLHVLVS